MRPQGPGIFHLLFLTTSFAPVFVTWLHLPSARSGPREHDALTSAPNLSNSNPRIMSFHMVKLLVMDSRASE